MSATQSLSSVKDAVKKMIGARPGLSPHELLDMMQYGFVLPKPKFNTQEIKNAWLTLMDEDEITFSSNRKFFTK